MKRLVCLVAPIAFAGLCAALAGCQQPRYLTVRVQGEYYEQGARGRLRYEGTLSYVWSDFGDRDPYYVALIADALCVDTGARYTLYGHAANVDRGLPLSYLAYDMNGQLAFTGLYSVQPAIPDEHNPVAGLAPLPSPMVHPAVPWGGAPAGTGTHRGVREACWRHSAPAATSVSMI